METENQKLGGVADGDSVSALSTDGLADGDSSPESEFVEGAGDIISAAEGSGVGLADGDSESETLVGGFVGMELVSVGTVEGHSVSETAGNALGGSGESIVGLRDGDSDLTVTGAPDDSSAIFACDGTLVGNETGETVGGEESKPNTHNSRDATAPGPARYTFMANTPRARGIL